MLLEKRIRRIKGLFHHTHRHRNAVEHILHSEHAGNLPRRRGTPRKLGVPGEEQTKVAYRLIDPEQYRDMHVLVVGGGDSALEAATCIAEEPGTVVTLSYRSGAFSRAKQKNREKVEAADQSGRLTVLLNSSVKEIFEDKAVIQTDEELIEIKNEAVIVSAGGILPTGFLKEIGIQVETKWESE